MLDACRALPKELVVCVSLVTQREQWSWPSDYIKREMRMLLGDILYTRVEEQYIARREIDAHTRH